MYFVYFLRSKSNPKKSYIGYTSNLNKRLKEHNGLRQEGYTKQFRPWEVEHFILAKTYKAAIKAERYFKSSSGQEKFKRFSENNPNCQNVIKGFFDTQQEGRKFGRSVIEIESNNIVTVRECSEEND